MKVNSLMIKLQEKLKSITKMVIIILVIWKSIRNRELVDFMRSKIEDLIMGSFIKTKKKAKDITFMMMVKYIVETLKMIWKRE